VNVEIYHIIQNYHQYVDVNAVMAVLTLNIFVREDKVIER
jgi:hypothetical protein